MHLDKQLDKPVLLIAFNRPEKTAQALDRIRQQRPTRLFLAADGPRIHVAEDVERCEAVRTILRTVDWPCEVHCDFLESNVGLRERVVTALGWAFEFVEELIVLEDDCIAHPDFFRFVSTLLDKYKHEPRVGMITGDNFQNGRKRGNASYYFSWYPHCWGWATWRRVWEGYDPSASFWPEWRLSREWHEVFSNSTERKYWEALIEETRTGAIDTWDYAWAASLWRQGMLTATPNANLVTNVGFGEDSTHTRGRGTHVPSASPLGPIRHPKEVIRDIQADRFTWRHHYRRGRLVRRLVRAFRNRMLPRSES